MAVSHPPAMSRLMSLIRAHCNASLPFSRWCARRRFLTQGPADCAAGVSLRLRATPRPCSAHTAQVTVVDDFGLILGNQIVCWVARRRSAEFPCSRQCARDRALAHAPASCDPEFLLPRRLRGGTAPPQGASLHSPHCPGTQRLYSVIHTGIQ